MSRLPSPPRPPPRAWSRRRKAGSNRDPGPGRPGRSRALRQHLPPPARPGPARPWRRQAPGGGQPASPSNGTAGEGLQLEPGSPERRRERRRRHRRPATAAGSRQALWVPSTSAPPAGERPSRDADADAPLLRGRNGAGLGRRHGDTAGRAGPVLPCPRVAPRRGRGSLWPRWYRSLGGASRLRGGPGAAPEALLPQGRAPCGEGDASPAPPWVPLFYGGVAPCGPSSAEPNRAAQPAFEASANHLPAA